LSNDWYDRCTITVVRVYVGVTNDDWYRFLAAHQVAARIGGGFCSRPGLGKVIDLSIHRSDRPNREFSNCTSIESSKPYKNLDAQRRFMDRYRSQDAQR
jgi:hypothetical protein